jgi:hypothetical protein
MNKEFVRLRTDEFINECLRIVDEARSRGVVLRVLGAVGIYIHSLHIPKALEIYGRVGRFEGSDELFTDLDLIAYSKQRKEVMEFFEKVLKFKYDLITRALFLQKRLIYHHPKDLYHADVFFDKLEFSHDVYFGEFGRGRLELDYPTIPLADLLLEKLQIHKVNMKDIVDMIVLLYGHEVCSSDRECIDSKYIAKVLADDWGFWYDATQNLEKVKTYVSKYVSEGKLWSDVEVVVKERINKILKTVEEEPKTDKWLKRAKIGTSKPWYREVEEVVR